MPLNKIPINIFQTDLFSVWQPQHRAHDETILHHRLNTASAQKNLWGESCYDNIDSGSQPLPCWAMWAEIQRAAAGCWRQFGRAAHERHHAEDRAFKSAVTGLWCITFTQTACCHLCLKKLSAWFSLCFLCHTYSTLRLRLEWVAVRWTIGLPNEKKWVFLVPDNCSIYLH